MNLPNRVRMAQLAMHVKSFEAYDANTRTEDGDAFEDMVLADGGPAVSGLALAEQERDLYLDAFEDIPGRQLLILGYLYYWDETLETVGQRFDLSRERIRQLRDRGLEALKEALEARGVVGKPRTLALWRFLDPA